MRSALLVAAAAATVSAQSSMPTCISQTQDLGVTYDLTDLMQQNQRIDDNRNETTSTWYDYYFGVCQDLDDSFFSGTGQSCWNTTGDDGSTTAGYGSAFQVGKASNVQGFCKRIGGPASSGVLIPMGDRRWRQGLASGVTLYYPGGDMCPDPFNATNFIPRSISLNFQCYDSYGFLPKYDTILEDVQCQYNAFIKSRVGCPLECKRGGPLNRVCSANGICGYDMTNSYAKCFCNTGYSGADCTVQGDAGLPPPKDWSPNIAGGFFGGLFGGLAAAVAFFMVKGKMSGGGLLSGFSFGGFGRGGSSSSGGYMPAPTSASWTGGASSVAGATAGGYVAPDATGAMSAAGGMGDVYAGLGSGDGPLINS